MGFGSVIATAMAIVVLLAAGYTLAAGITGAADSTGAALRDAADRELRQGNTALAVTSLNGSVAGGNLTIGLDNAGTEKIDNVSRMDVIVTFLDAGAARWYPYRFAGATPASYWEVAGITSQAPGIGDAVNPGMLDPGEAMVIAVRDESALPGNLVRVQVTAPDGVSASYEWAIGA